MAIRAIRAALSNLSTQRRQKGWVVPRACTGSGPPCTKLVTHDSEQISAATVAHHTVYENTRNLQRSPCLSMGNTFVPGGCAISSRGQTSFCATTAKGHFALDNNCKWSKWHISSTQTSNRIMLYFCNRRFCGTQSKKRGPGNNPILCSAALTP